MDIFLGFIPHDMIQTNISKLILIFKIFINLENLVEFVIIVTEILIWLWLMI